MTHSAANHSIPLAYWRAALAEVNLLHPVVPPEAKPVTFGRTDQGWAVTGALPDVEQWVASQFGASKAGNAQSANGKAVERIPFVLIPARLSEQVSASVKPEAVDLSLGLSLICIPCLLGRQGELYPDPERQPWIARDLLQPNIHKVAIGTLQAYDNFMSGLPNQPITLEDSLKMAAALFYAVTGAQLPTLRAFCSASNTSNPSGTAPEFKLADYQLVSSEFGLPWEPPVMARHLIKLYDQLIEKQPATPLLAHLCDTRTQATRAPVALEDSAVQYAACVGHIDPTHPLSPSQREALVESGSLPQGAILAVNGPPGTGKTTMLHGMVAQLWVDAALRQAPCPLILVASTNVKAVENVLDSFGKIAGKIGHQRWLPYAGGFGLFLAAASRETRFPVCDGKNHPFEALESANAIESATQIYLKHAATFFQESVATVADVCTRLHARLAHCHSKLAQIMALRFEIFQATGRNSQAGAQVLYQQYLAMFEKMRLNAQAQRVAAEQATQQCQEAIAAAKASFAATDSAINAAEQAWANYLANSPWWLDLLAFLPAIGQRRNARDRAFLLNHPLTASLANRHDKPGEQFQLLRQQAQAAQQAELASQAAVLREAEQQQAQAVQQAQLADQQQQAFNQLWQRWLEALAPDYHSLENIALDKLNDRLDTLIRAPMFGLADWYWSGQWLQEVTLRQQQGLQDKKSPAKLEAKYRRFAKLAPCLVSNFHIAPSFFTGWQGEDLPLWNGIDWLIVDEAGQVSPDIGAGMFALAKRAVVVGDTFQIEPVWNCAQGTDRSNAKNLGLLGADDSAAAARYEQLADAGFMAASGNLMRMAAHACELQKYPEMRGLMLTEHRRCVPELVQYCNDLVYAGRLQPMRPALAPSQRLLPAFGWLDVQGMDSKVGKSRKNWVEAQEIVQWVAKNRSRIENHYRNKRTGEVKPIWELLAIITPFATQASQIERAMRKNLPELTRKDSRLTIGTVHALQGAEREIVIFSPTYGPGHAGSMFFDASPNLLNVAVSRARDSFLVIGNISKFDPAMPGKPSGLLGKFLRDSIHGGDISA